MTIDKNTETLNRIYEATVSRITKELNEIFRNKISNLEQLHRANKLLDEYRDLTKKDFELYTENSII